MPALHSPIGWRTGLQSNTRRKRASVAGRRLSHRLLGLGYDIAERMGLLPDLKSEGYVIQEMRTENSRGRRIGGFDVDVCRKLVRGRYVSIPRSSLSRMIYPSAIAMAKLVGWANASQKIGYAFHGSHERLVGMMDQQMGAQSSGVEQFHRPASRAQCHPETHDHSSSSRSAFWG